ncbi:hypothetical protein PC2016_0704 [Pseudoalteromonas carrageenovora]|uniref:DUF2339 domain-containing protein n=1 Tax=Pseudoalteromonas carrageenovora IAM 12662 TaxID=1314868 RepID=A0A2K4X6R3_PSEVC|nr:MULTISPECIES: DUF2339 domain-containing protein [Pseudoalteromonas]KTF17360.1 hypothetical protein ATS74_01230 [Pseudoalteromonas sp. H103]MBE0382219.1 hypothetical protein [Pseudoalteromonas carrageenovora IAM 12662]QBJ70944.1 hypothetical protein PC2016_0704 [Pseudoalteromonas carrageenovora]SOU40014.1 conserved membrane protein of unknown function [Pseudoalteromonas carrageenovora IAM 12662]GEB71334.1 membrane protein [Pseudoalteromonas carrageenovora]
MDDLVGLAVIAMLVIAAGALCGLIALIQLNGLKQEIAVLRAKVTKLQASKVVPFNNVQGEVKDPDPEPQAMAINTEPTLAIQSAPIGAVKQKPAAPKKAKPATPSFITTLFEKLRTGFEQNWMTWIGAIALAFGGIFLAKYSLEAGLLSPLTRLSLGGVFGLSLIAVASYLHYKRIIFEGFNNYIPAALASGGFITCFALTLLAYSSYSMISPTAAFIVLAIIAISASAMALKLGPLLAVLGIIGAYSVPIWVNTGSNNLLALFMYVGFVSLSASLVAQKVQRAWLWYLLWAGHIGWYLVGFLITQLKSNTPWLFATFALLSIVGLIALPRLGLKLKSIEHRPHSLKRLVKVLPDHLLLLAFIVPLIFTMSISYYTLQWQAIGVLSIGLLLLLVLKNSRWDLWQGLSLVIAILMIISAEQMNSLSAFFDDGLFIFKSEYGLGLLLGFGFMAYGLYFGKKYIKRLAFHISAAFSVFVMIGTLYSLIPNSALSTAYPLWAFVLFVVAAILIKCAQHNTTLFQRFTYWVGANANITLAITMLLSDSGLTIALAIQVLLISVLIKRFNVPMPHWPIKALVAALLLRLTLAPWTPSYDALTLFGLHWSIIVYPLCTALFFAAAKCYKSSQLKVWLEGAALHCLALFITTETSYQLVGHYPQFDSLSFYEQILLTCNWLALGCVYLHRARIAGSLTKLYQIAGGVLAGGAGFISVKTLLDDNPLLSSIYIGELPVFNWLFLLWLVPAGLTIWLYSLIKPINAKVAPFVLGVAGLLGLIAINSFIRQYWQGPYIYLSKGASNAELYSYSIIWLILGAGTVILGHLKNQLLIQKIGLGLLAAVIVKVFLIDMANLTGLLKALSFIGLGLSLVGLSWLFQKLRSRSKVI